jgi:dipeptidyl aminopeptidase/acylaminoacyl peptidase
LAFSPNGKTLASLDTEGDCATLWDTTSGEKLMELTGIRRQKWVAFAPDGQTLAAIGEKTVGLWNAATGEQVTSASFQVDRSVGSFALSPNGKWLAVELGRGTIELFNVGTREKRTLSGEQGCSEGLLFSPDGEMLVSGDEQIYLRDVATATQRAKLAGHTERVVVMAVSPDGRRLASGGYDETVRLWDVATGDPRSVLLGHTGFVGSIEFSPDSASLTSICSNGLIRRWDASNGQELSTVTVPRDRNNYLLSPDGKLLIDVDRNNAVNVLDMTTGDKRLLAKP